MEGRGEEPGFTSNIASLLGEMLHPLFLPVVAVSERTTSPQKLEEAKPFHPQPMFSETRRFSSS